MTLSLPFSIRVDGSEADIQAFAGELRVLPWFGEFHFNPVQYDTGYQLWIYSNDDETSAEVEREREHWILEACVRHNLMPMELVHEH
ncbi:hypothetical protein DES53_11057 [Roseimicrobium gellanilyticum]|uniref:Uncharacterized protein n=1 Tax=Roseimicrobium gellanilyticum TaxID=748857 RepID=A0A366HBL2_9BACT|nr:hypothetical protein [Roseimicrobium gellanilyticum]RBP39034.1 hypothetical protein DES53_11057 [Roseimicrobium gellanilyticum]